MRTSIPALPPRIRSPGTESHLGPRPAPTWGPHPTWGPQPSTSLRAGTRGLTSARAPRWSFPRHGAGRTGPLSLRAGSGEPGLAPTTRHRDGAVGPAAVPRAGTEPRASSLCGDTGPTLPSPHSVTQTRLPSPHNGTEPHRAEPNRRTPAHLPRARSRRRRRRLDRTWRRPAGRCRLAAALCNSAPCRPEGAMRRGEAAPPREPRERCSAHPDQQGALPARGLRCERWGRAGAVGCPVPSRRVSVW